MFTSIPAWLRFIIWLLIAILVILILALVVHALGGFNWNLRIGHFHFNIGVT